MWLLLSIGLASSTVSLDKLLLGYPRSLDLAEVALEGRVVDTRVVLRSPPGMRLSARTHVTIRVRECFRGCNAETRLVRVGVPGRSRAFRMHDVVLVLGTPRTSWDGVERLTLDDWGPAFLKRQRGGVAGFGYPSAFPVPFSARFLGLASELEPSAIRWDGLLQFVRAHMDGRPPMGTYTLNFGPLP